MREVWLMRHGAAEATSPGGDAQRRLTNAGRAVVERVAAFVGRWGVRADALWASPYVRADETARLIAPAFGAPPIETKRDLIPEGPTGDVADAIRGAGGTLVVVSHLPLLPSVLGVLTGARVELATATLVHLAIIDPRGAAAILGLYPSDRIAA